MDKRIRYHIEDRWRVLQTIPTNMEHYIKRLKSSKLELREALEISNTRVTYKTSHEHISYQIQLGALAKAIEVEIKYLRECISEMKFVESLGRYRDIAYDDDLIKDVIETALQTEDRLTADDLDQINMDLEYLDEMEHF